MAMLVVGCTSDRTATEVPATTRAPSLAPATPAPTVRPDATVAPTMTPPDEDLLVAVPAELRRSCVAFDLSDADPEIVCEADGVELYLATWATTDELLATVREDLDLGECDLLDAARGSITVAGDRIGRGGGCSDDPTFVFANEEDRIEGHIYIAGGTFADTQAWFRTNRPTLAAKGKVAGAAVDPPVGELDVERLMDRAERVAYRTLLRDAEDYTDTLLYYRGRVLQVIDEGEALVEVTRAEGSWRDIVYVDYVLVERLLEGDIVDFVGPGAGIYEYLTVLGDENDVPAIEAIDLRIRG